MAGSMKQPWTRVGDPDARGTAQRTPRTPLAIDAANVSRCQCCAHASRRFDECGHQTGRMNVPVLPHEKPGAHAFCEVGFKTSYRIAIHEGVRHARRRKKRLLLFELPYFAIVKRYLESPVPAIFDIQPRVT